MDKVIFLDIDGILNSETDFTKAAIEMENTNENKKYDSTAVC